MYFITCFEKIGLNEYGLDIGCQRTFGYKETLEQAEEALSKNTLDMWETVYNYAIVEKMGPYIHPICEERYFYKYDREKNGFFRIEEPNEFKHYCNIALG